MTSEKNTCKRTNPLRCEYPHCECHPTTIGDLIKATIGSIKDKIKQTGKKL